VARSSSRVMSSLPAPDRDDQSHAKSARTDHIKNEQAPLTD